MEGDTYLVVISSQAQPASEFFEKGNVEAVQCLAAYEISPADGGVFMRVVSHPNPHVYSLLNKMGFLWHRYSEEMLGEWAAQLSTAAQQLANKRKQGSGATVLIDEGALTLLQPIPPGRNNSISLQYLLYSTSLLDDFAQLDIPAQLNSSAEFENCS